MVLVLNIFILVSLPFGTAILAGLLAERLGGKIVSAWASMGGLFLGVYFVHKVFEITGTF